MQLLQQQYTTFKTHKLRVVYTDFVFVSTSFYNVTLITIPRAFEVLGVKIWHRGAFVAAPMTTCILYVNLNTFPLESNIQNRALCRLNAMQAANDYSGAIKMQQPMLNQSISPSGEFICNQSADTKVNASLVRTGAVGNPAFTAGTFDIWIMTAKMA